MKTAVSLSDELFKKADKVAKKLKISRSRLFAMAVESFVEPLLSEQITESLNEIYSDRPQRLDAVVGKLQARSLPREAW